jgi:hypothetical protein
MTSQKCESGPGPPDGGHVLAGEGDSIRRARAGPQSPGARHAPGSARSATTTAIWHESGPSGPQSIETAGLPEGAVVSVGVGAAEGASDDADADALTFVEHAARVSPRTTNRRRPPRMTTPWRRPTRLGSAIPLGQSAPASVTRCELEPPAQSDLLMNGSSTSRWRCSGSNTSPAEAGGQVCA